MGKGLIPDDLQTQLDALPPSLMLVEIPFHRCTPDALKALRSQFNRDIKPAFLRHLGRNHALELAAMGLNGAAVARMRDWGEYPENKKGERLNASIDHIVSLTLGGTNEFSNLMLLPRRLNDLKNAVETLQLDDGCPSGTLRTIAPRVTGDAPSPVPFVPGGFERERLHR